ncbi:hypothetical protein ElyMa_002935900 [Elysia marginata]|uniref:Uncharacterized protein n=1 Tax=Elysia marginata TaxID=1093978 RepID=A0AAV4I8B6_9GAST|nr:hypothetical protein ElyMa_002935900 [Elysia marginata]
MVELKTFGFGLKAFKRFPELIPLVSIVITMSSFGTFFLVYSVATKPDVRLVKSRGPPHEDVGWKDSTKVGCPMCSGHYLYLRHVTTLPVLCDSAVDERNAESRIWFIL